MYSSNLCTVCSAFTPPTENGFLNIIPILYILFKYSLPIGICQEPGYNNLA